MINTEKFPKTSGVYCFINLVNNKVYIGSSVNLKRRIRAHVKTLNASRHTNKHFQSAWDKYGEDNFSCEIIILVEPYILLENEQYFIDFYQAANKRYGYNSSPSAKNTLGYRFSEEQRNKMKLICNTPEYKMQMSETSKQLWANKNHKKRMSLLAKQRWQDPKYRLKIANAIEGKAREKMSQASKEWWQNPDNHLLLGEKAKERWKDKEYREKMIASQMAYWTEEQKRNQSSKLKKYHNNLTEEKKKEISAMKKSIWAKLTPEQKAKRLAGFQKRWNRNKS